MKCACVRDEASQCIASHDSDLKIYNHVTGCGIRDNFVQFVKIELLTPQSRVSPCFVVVTHELWPIAFTRLCLLKEVEFRENVD